MRRHLQSSEKTHSVMLTAPGDAHQGGSLAFDGTVRMAASVAG